MELWIKELEEKAELLKAIAHPIRLCIIKGLLLHEGRNVTAIRNCLEKPQSTISQHLGRLRAAGIVEGRRKGLEVEYYIVNENIKLIADAIFNEQ